MRSLPFGATSLAVLSAVMMSGCAVSPTELTVDALAANAIDKMTRVTLDQEPISGVVDLHQAMARALKYNLDQKVELFDAALRVAELDLSHYNLLPNAVANSGYSVRDSQPGSSSFNLVTRNQNFGYSTSQDQRARTTDLTFSWNILDFGLSYVRARQAADKVLLSAENRRKVVHRLMEDVRTAYWRAYSAQKLVGRLRVLEARTKAALAGSRALVDERTTSPITAITYRRELIEIQRVLQDLQRDLSVAKFQLSALMNVRPGTAFTLAPPNANSKPPVAIDDVAGLVRIALESRPEIRDVAYRQRINVHEADAALLELLPGLQMFVGSNIDNNSFLLHDQWLAWGAKASWNVMKVFQYPGRRGVIEAQDKLLDQRALALTMAIMTQVHVSRVRVALIRKEVAIAAAYHETQQELVGNIRSEHAADRVSEQTLLREELNAAVGEVRLDIAKASLQTAMANLVTSIGLDPIGDTVALEGSVNDIATALRVQAPSRPVQLTLAHQ